MPKIGYESAIAVTKREAVEQIADAVRALKHQTSRAEAALVAGDIGMVHVVALSVKRAADALIEQGMRAATAHKIMNDANWEIEELSPAK